MRDYQAAVADVKKALDQYATEIQEIKQLTAVQIEIRTDAQEALQDELIHDPGAFGPE
ncbi:hypothetical protein [Microbacterium sp. cx-59]|uniref:hypothetical protein n=1 Tax=Microbacterium sp. cx-59 TaxID=2891207 RepID=UPI001E5947AF|nr:hypothetical protein [Microbacterium sp. cx-59]MCC4909220.1 hypothetical protein [Microbacterium sp. cx-59]